MADRMLQILRALDVVAANGDLSATSRRMLAEGLPHALAQGARTDASGGGRHEYQTQFLAQVRAVLGGARDRAEAARALAAHGEAVEAARALLGEAEEAARVAGEAEEAARAEAVAKATALAEAERLAGENEAEHSQEEAAAMLVDERCKRVEQQKMEATDVADALKMLVGTDREEEADAMVAAIRDVQQFLKSIEAEDALVAGAAAALEQDPSERREFDVFTLGEIDDVMQQHFAVIDPRLADAKREKENAFAVAFGAWAIADVARDRVVEVKGEFSEFEAKLADAVAARKAATSNAGMQHRIVKANKRREEVAAEAFQHFTDALDALERLSAAELVDADEERGDDDDAAASLAKRAKLITEVAEEARDTTQANIDKMFNTRSTEATAPIA